jgi:uncharacterized repeat protein (TIGR03803 family)
MPTQPLQRPAARARTRTPATAIVSVLAVLALTGCFDVTPREPLGLSVVHVFDPQAGESPARDGLVIDSQDNLYGIVQTGVRRNDRTKLYRLRATDAGYEVVHDFGAGNDSFDPVIDDQDTILGVADRYDNGYTSTVYRWSAAAGYQVLARLDDGFSTGALAFDDAGVLYGPFAVSSQPAAVMRIGLDGSVAPLKAFGSNDQLSPVAWHDGQLFGGTWRFDGSTRAGHLFRLAADGSTYLRVDTGGDCYAFFNGPTIDAEGNTWGTATLVPRRGCPTDGEDGIVYRVDQATGRFEVVHVFGSASGGSPSSRLRVGRDGHLYGTTFHGGDPVCDCGGVYRVIAAQRRVEVLYRFRGRGDGAYPRGDLALDSLGRIHGVARSGVTTVDGVDTGLVWRFTMP